MIEVLLGGLDPLQSKPLLELLPQREELARFDPNGINSLVHCEFEEPAVDLSQGVIFPELLTD